MAEDENTRRMKERLRAVDTGLKGVLGSLGEALDGLVDAAERTAEAANSTDPEAAPALKTDVRVRVGGLVADGAASAAPRPRSGKAGGPNAAPRGTPSARHGGSRPSDPPSDPPSDTADDGGTGRAPEETQVAAEVFQDAGRWVALFDMPGAALSDIALEERDGELLVTATGRRRYAAKTRLPAGLGAADLKTAMTHGVLEISGEVAQ